MTRRDLLHTMGAGFGMVGLARPGRARRWRPIRWRRKAPHFPAKAKRVIYLFLNGGPSQVDTFDPKPKLTEYHGKPIPAGNLRTRAQDRQPAEVAVHVQEVRAERHRRSARSFPKLGECADDLCVIRSMYTDRPNHEPSLFMLNSGEKLPGRPSMGSWVTYGLGTENQNLPGFVVLCPGLPVVGHQLWSSTFLPAVYQGTYINTEEKGSDKLIQNIRNKSLTREQQREELDLLAKLNRQPHRSSRASDPQLEASHPIGGDRLPHAGRSARTHSTSRKETAKTRERYGDSDFGRGCLIARRLAERGVRMVQVYFGNCQPWDNHDDIQIHRTLAAQADPPIAALLQDLKASGMLKDTLVMIGGEFGRTPAVEVSGLIKVQNGRDHNNQGFSYVLAGGGVKGGHGVRRHRRFRLQGGGESGAHSRSARHRAAPDGAGPHAADLSLQRPRFPADGCRGDGGQGHSGVGRQKLLEANDCRAAVRRRAVHARRRSAAKRATPPRAVMRTRVSSAKNYVNAGEQ